MRTKVDDVETLKNDPRLSEIAKRSGCSTDEMFARICRVAGIRVAKKVDK